MGRRAARRYWREDGWRDRPIFARGARGQAQCRERRWPGVPRAFRFFPRLRHGDGAGANDPGRSNGLGQLRPDAEPTPSLTVAQGRSRGGHGCAGRKALSCAATAVMSAIWGKTRFRHGCASVIDWAGNPVGLSAGAWLGRRNRSRPGPLQGTHEDWTLSIQACGHSAIDGGAS
jgi:hypothetical protein